MRPWMDQDGVIRVGGWIQRINFSHVVKHPILLSPKHAVMLSILSLCHDKVRHQGRLITIAAVRQAGYHTNPRSVLSSFFKSCTICKHMRGELLTQRMVQLPRDRVERTAPFQKSGMDVFGPCLIYNDKSTCRTIASRKL